MKRATMKCCRFAASPSFKLATDIRGHKTDARMKIIIFLMKMTMNRMKFLPEFPEFPDFAKSYIKRNLKPWRSQIKQHLILIQQDQ